MSVIEFPAFAPYGPKDPGQRRRLARLFAGRSIIDLRYMWDNMSEDSFYHAPNGDMFDCADVHGYLNMLGDGAYCAV